jgi:hypothetical protein
MKTSQVITAGDKVYKLPQKFDLPAAFGSQQAPAASSSKCSVKPMERNVRKRIDGLLKLMNGYVACGAIVSPDFKRDFYILLGLMAGVTTASRTGVRIDLDIAKVKQLFTLWLNVMEINGDQNLKAHKGVH